MTSPTTTLRDEQTSMTALLDLIKQEQQFLIRADADGLAALNPQKSDLIAQMGVLSKQRHAALQADGFDPADAGMQAYLSAHPQPEAQAEWDALLAATREAKNLNRINGVLIARQLAHTHNLLQAMRTPTAAAADPGLYGPKGQTSSIGSSRRFVVG